ncbi:PssE/Cps14G family polysaccharide biosynthesis glycosyltransferase [Thomasclavelia saccharogumia]|uniref:PssE/Cps14G family polysaccharide biosynthesis glycosyltransferase n=1 Tax=Thomasclavelia saccharogumia TaxID=341225 RepID=UPI00047EBA21|nr:PssE/Cps14G family polysaccharide biosynthesis glycosyltransferase [Thomasclavelia saccharogumia]
MRIFVMFGTQDKRFDRLLNAILESKFVKENDVYVQLGYTKGTYQGINCQEYYSEEELNHQIKIADLVITHAGVGAIVASLKQKKRTIVVPRLGKYKEQNNDHQVQIMERFNKQGYIIPCNDLSKLDEIVNQAHTFEPKEYRTEKQGIIDEIINFINNI